MYRFKKKKKRRKYNGMQGFAGNNFKDAFCVTLSLKVTSEPDAVNDSFPMVIDDS